MTDDRSARFAWTAKQFGQMDRRPATDAERAQAGLPPREPAATIPPDSEEKPDA